MSVPIPVLLLEIAILKLLRHSIEVELLVSTIRRVLIALLLPSSCLSRLGEHPVEVHLDARVLSLQLREHVLYVTHYTL